MSENLIEQAWIIKYYCICKATVTYKWCFLFNEGINQLINVFRNWRIESTSSSKGGLKKKLIGLQKKGKNLTSNTRLDINACPFFTVLVFNAINQVSEEVQEHKFQFRPRTRNRRSKRYLWLSHHIQFPEEAIRKWIKELTTSSCQWEDFILTHNLFIPWCRRVYHREPGRS